MKLFIITINYNGSENTTKLLRSLYEQTDRDFEIVIVDNASDGADFISLQTATEGIVAKMPFVASVVRNKKNLGFSGGNNVGIGQALENRADWVLLLNNDTWVGEDFIASLRVKLGSSGGIVGLPLVEEDRTAYCGRIEWLKPTLRHDYENSKFQIPPACRTGRNSKFYAVGGAMVISKDAFDKIGELDEKYFLYFEDADFCVRARRAKIPISITDKVMIHHNVSATTKKLGSPLLLRYHYRNALYFNRKNGPWYIKVAVWPWSWVIILKQFLKMGLNINEEESRAILDGVFDWYMNRMGRVKS